ncbi:dUTP diphosphatase [candidate division WOR-3 bacterium]|nr:dUTP diphosphatase [candidate division WOR-3 bacterium]
MILRIKKLIKNAQIPNYQTSGASGMDLYAFKKVTIPPNEYALIHTGISVEVPSGFEAQIRPRSGLALNYGIGVLNSPGTIDTDYRGELKVILFNFGKKDFKVEPGMRIAQFVITKVYRVNIAEEKLSTTHRGVRGFGSTGI